MAISNHRLLACDNGQVRFTRARSPQRRPTQTDVAVGGRIHPPLPDACFAGSLHPRPATAVCRRRSWLSGCISRLPNALGHIVVVGYEGTSLHNVPQTNFQRGPSGLLKETSAPNATGNLSKRTPESFFAKLKHRGTNSTTTFAHPRHAKTLPIGPLV